MSFNATIIADSKSEIGNHRLCTVKATFPRYLLAEFNTHKMISKSSASSRAIPAKKLRESVKNNPYIPERWMKDHKGMQGSSYYDDPEDITLLRTRWEMYKDEAIHNAGILNGEPFSINDTQYRYDVSKQVANRLLEPFMYHTALMSATEWENFFALRAEAAAEDNFQKTAYLILDAMNASAPKQLKAGEWHLPYGDDIDSKKLSEFTLSQLNSEATYTEVRVKITTARCAGTSYVLVGEDGKEEDYQKLIDRHDKKLVEFGHWSPMEHPGRSMNEQEYFNHTHTFILYGKAADWYFANTDAKTYTAHKTMDNDGWKMTEYGWSGNFRGFLQYRKMFPTENRRDSRLLKK